MFAFILILHKPSLSSSSWHLPKLSGTAPATHRQRPQRLDAQTEKCLELHRQLAEQETKGAVMMERHTTLQRFYAHNSGLVEEYARALAAKERRLEEVDDKLLAAIDDRDAKIEVIASLKYNEEQYQEEIDDLRAELGAQAE
ncbi:hypothetical protein LPJ62_000041 [Coemansia sp. RSA 2167]|nr:hypothetical protein LPJ62_000041 [Coemansia sp. RSA 2167]